MLAYTFLDFDTVLFALEYLFDKLFAANALATETYQQNSWAQYRQEVAPLRDVRQEKRFW